jgi:hypothetical protein
VTGKSPSVEHTFVREGDLVHTQENDRGNPCSKEGRVIRGPDLECKPYGREGRTHAERNDISGPEFPA